MARRTKFEPVKTPNGWRLNVPAKYTESGKRERHFFDTQKKAAAAAKDFKKAAEEFGHRSQAITPSLAEAATEAADILAPWKVSLLEAARMVADIYKARAASHTLTTACDAWLLACESLRPRTLDGYTQTAAKLKTALGDKILATITAGEIQAAVCPLGSSGAWVEGHLRNAKAFWRWSAKKGWCNADVFNGVEKPKGGRDTGEIEILTVDQASNLLAVAAEHYPQAVASYALQLFAGIRTEEIKRMEAHHVTADGIELAADITKKGRRRHITPSDTLAAWLKAYPFQPCENWRETDKACRRLAGWAVESRLLKEPEPATLGAWPQNALRHSHASYSVAAGVPLESLLFEFGHAGNPTLLRQHYVGRASKKDALAYFAIVPKGKAKPKRIQLLKKGAA
jgi:site-specific recombinase XerD